MLACVLVGDRRFGGPARRSPDEDCAGLGGALDARRGVDEVAGDHALALGSDRDGGLPRENACACLQGCVELWHSGDEVEPGPDGALRVVLLGDRCSPDGHDGIADELLDCAAIAVDDGSRRLEVEREKLARVLRVALCGCGGEADEVGEEDGDEAAFGRWARLLTGATAAGAVVVPSAVPHSPQNFTDGAFGVPHDGHVCASVVPHSPQNFRPASFAEPHAGQEIVSDTAQL